MTTVFINSVTGDDARTYAQAQNSATPWASPLKADASATATDIVNVAANTYLSTAYTGAPTFFSYAKPLTYTAQSFGTVTLQSSGTLYVGRISGSFTANGTLNLNGIVYDGQRTDVLTFDIGDMGSNIWTINWANCIFKDATQDNILMTFNKRGTFTTTDCTFSGTPSASGFRGASAVGAGGIAGTGALTITHTRPVFNLTSTGGYSGILQDITGGTPGNTITYTVTGATGTCTTTGATASINGIYLRTPGASVSNSNDLTIAAPATNSGTSTGIYIYPDSANMADIPIQDNKVVFLAPGGYGITLGDSTAVATGTLTGGIITGNTVSSQYYASKTPHGIVVGRATTVTTHTGNTVYDIYACYLASLTTSGTASANSSKDSYGVDYYAKGCTAFTFTGNTAIQTGKYARRLLGPFSIDSQGGVVTVATTFSYNRFICAETDFSRVGALANITVNNNGTFTGNTYIIPDTWDTDTTDRFFVGGTEGGRDGATGYTIDEWVSGTAGSISATNGTGTIAISGETVIKKPIAQIRQLAGVFSSGQLVYVPGLGIAVIP